MFSHRLDAIHGASPNGGSKSSPGRSARQGLPKEGADPHLLHCPGAAKREEKQPECLLCPADDAQWDKTEELPTHLVGHCTGTHQKVTTQEPQGQRKTRELVAFPFSSSSAASPAEPFPPLSTWSRLRARHSSGRGVLPRLQRRAAGSDLEVAEPPGSPLVPACHGHGHRCIRDQGAGRLGLLLGCPYSCALVPGPGLGRKGSWALPVLLGLGDDQGVSEEEEVPLLPLAMSLGNPHVLPEQRLVQCLVRRALLVGARVIPAGQTALGMSKVAAAGPSCPSASPSCGGTHLDPQQQSHCPIPTGLQKDFQIKTRLSQVGNAPPKKRSTPSAAGAASRSTVRAGTGAVARPAPG